MKTNNHPANGPVSLERLHQIREILSKAAAQSDGGNLGYAMADAVKVINEVLERRKADKPVMYQSRLRRGGGLWDELSESEYSYLRDTERGREYFEVRALYASPQPAPDSEAQATLKRLAMIMRGSEVDLNLLTVTAQSLVDHCKAYAEPVVPPSLQTGNPPVTPDCWCRTCRPVTMNDMRFVVCPDCGNKRCPHANDHNNACTGSNETGQVGSAYPAAPQQEVK
ncbi:hypothetical protein [Citrobacter europaeus]|uniref:hypothetical protein n=1 Tax=Citrobacter europaeus TaxID=1914243 RepID=UPI0039C412DA